MVHKAHNTLCDIRKLRVLAIVVCMTKGGKTQSILSVGMYKMPFFSSSLLNIQGFESSFIFFIVGDDGSIFAPSCRTFDKPHLYKFSLPTD